MGAKEYPVEYAVVSPATDSEDTFEEEIVMCKPCFTWCADNLPHTLVRGILNEIKHDAETAAEIEVSRSDVVDVESNGPESIGASATDSKECDQKLVPSFHLERRFTTSQFQIKTSLGSTNAAERISPASSWSATSPAHCHVVAHRQCPRH